MSEIGRALMEAPHREAAEQARAARTPAAGAKDDSLFGAA
jgi:hypothetical protein